MGETTRRKKRSFIDASLYSIVAAGKEEQRLFAFPIKLIRLVKGAGARGLTTRAGFAPHDTIVYSLIDR